MLAFLGLFVHALGHMGRLHSVFKLLCSESSLQYNIFVIFNGYKDPTRVKRRWLKIEQKKPLHNNGLTACHGREKGHVLQ